VALFNAVTALAEQVTGKKMVVHIVPADGGEMIDTCTTPLSVSFVEREDGSMPVFLHQRGDSTRVLPS